MKVKKLMLIILLVYHFGIIFSLTYFVEYLFSIKIHINAKLIWSSILSVVCSIIPGIIIIRRQAESY